MEFLKKRAKTIALLIGMILFLSSCAYLNLLTEINDQKLKDMDDSSSLDTPAVSDLKYPIIKEPLALPFSGFIENRGQIIDKSLAYYYCMGGMIVSFSSSKINFALFSCQDIQQSYFSITFPGSQEVIPIGQGLKSHYINFFIGDFQQTNVLTYNEVWYYDLYPGIDLRYYMSIEGLKYEFIIQPGANPDLIKLLGSSSIKFFIEDKNISFLDSVQEKIYLQDSKLKVYQDDGTDISANFVSKSSEENCYGFRIASFDNSQRLIIDPLILSFSTYLGGSSYDYGYDIVVDSENATYILGQTNSLSFPITPGTINDSFNGGTSDLFIAKLDPVGNNLIFSTYLGGSKEDSGYRIALDTSNNTYITGKTASLDFPTTSNAFSESFNGGEYDIFVTKLNATGNKLVFSTYLGGAEGDYGREIVVDASGNTYITGETESLDFPTTPDTIDDTHNGGTSDAFIVKLNTGGDNLVYSTFIGGGGNDYGYSIAIDDFNNVCITGETWSSNFPVVGAYDNTKGGNTDAFLTKINADGDGFVFSTYLGGSGLDYGYDIAVDSYNNMYITGKTTSVNFPTRNPYSSYRGGYDAFVTKINSAGDDLVFSTFLGGSGEDSGHAITVDVYNNTYITGRTASTDFSTPLNAFNNTHSGSYDAFVTKLDALGNKTIFNTFLGGEGEDFGHGIEVDAYNETYIVGYTRSNDFPTYNAYSSTYSGSYDCFITKFNLDEEPPKINLESPANNTIHNSGKTINFTVRDLHLSNVLFNWDEGINQTLTESFIITLPMGDDQHRLNVYAVDRAGNWAYNYFTFTTDDTAPLVYLISPGNWIYPEIIVDLSGDADHYWYYIDGVDIDNQTWTTAITRNLSNGTYTLHAFGNDTVGNEAYTSVSFTIDTSFALVVIDSPVNASYSSNNTSIELSGDAESYWFYIRGFHDENQTYLPPVTFNLTDGKYVLHAYGNNTVGNVTHVSVTFTIDTIPPEVTIISPINTLYTSGSITINLFGDADFTWYYIEGVDIENHTWTSLVKRNLTNGTYTLFAYGNDTAGNEAVTSITFSIDTTRATVIIESPISTTYSYSTITIAFSGDALFYLYQIPGVVNIDTVWTSPITYYFEDGTYTLYGSGFKTMGKTTYVNVTFTVDTTPPTIILNSPTSSSIYRSSNVSIDISGNAERYWYYIENIDSENQTWTQPMNRSLSDGNYIIHIYGNDSVGNIAHLNLTFTISIPIPTSIPSTSSMIMVSGTTVETSSSTPKRGNFPNYTVVILILTILVIFIRGRKKKQI
ncbi:MAG: SBBP repeat-containing protein [Promethearchaeota archaeon]